MIIVSVYSEWFVVSLSLWHSSWVNMTIYKAIKHHSVLVCVCCRFFEVSVWGVLWSERAACNFSPWQWAPAASTCLKCAAQSRPALVGVCKVNTRAYTFIFLHVFLLWKITTFMYWKLCVIERNATWTLNT